MMPEAIGKKKPKPKPKPTPKPLPPLSRCWLYLRPADLDRLTVPAGVTDLISTPLDHQRFTWAGSESDVRTAAALLLSKAQGKPIHLFCWLWGAKWQTQNPWAASDEEWSAFLERLRWWKSAGIAGFVFDAEDEGRVARRNATTGAVEQPWFPNLPKLRERGASMAASCAGVGMSIYGTFWMKLSAYGYNGQLNPPKLPAAGFWTFALGLGTGWRYLVADTFGSNISDASITNTQQRIAKGDAGQPGLPALKVVPGSWLSVPVPSYPRQPDDLSLIAAARRLGTEAWIYSDAGVPVADLTRLGTALK